MPDRRRLIRLIVPVFLLLGLACGPCNLLSGEAPTPPQPIVISTELATQLESRIRQSLGGEPGQQFILRMTDDEVTSLVSIKLAQYDESPITEPQIWFTRGLIYGTGHLVNVLPVATRVSFVGSARILDNKVVVDVDEVSAGAIPLPESLLRTVSQSINETVEDLQLDVEVTALEILEGEVIIKGIRK
jgi:hypothetical protein